MIRWWRATRAAEVAKWRHKYRIEWDATDERDGGADRTVWETLLRMERFSYHAGERDQGAIALVLDLVKAFDRVSLPVVSAWATHFKFSHDYFACAMRVLRAPAEGAVRRMCGRTALDHHSRSPSVNVELLAPTRCRTL